MTLPAARTGDAVGPGVIASPGQTFVTVGALGLPWAVVGATISPHGAPPHDVATMAQGSTFVTIGGVPACASTHLASCSHAATGTGHVTVSS